MYLAGDRRIMDGMERSRRRPELDGLRGLAVLLVVVSHLSETSLRPLGMAGVVIFFTLSGYLITGLLMAEASAGRISFGHFYARRARRLLPAALTCIAVVSAVTLAFGAFAPGLTFASLAYGANWLLVVQPGGGAGPLGHMWSLSIEEQFYLLWPLALVLLLRVRLRALVGPVLALGVLGSLALRVHYAGDWARVYYGFDTRVDALLIGCALALFLRRPFGSALAWLPWLLLISASTVVMGARTLYIVAPFVVAVLTAAVIAGRPARVLTWRPLGLVGQRSYGLYLWHWPVLVALRAVLDGPGWVVLTLIGLPLSWAITVASWRWIEEPWLRKGVDLHDGRARSARPARV